MTTPRNTSPLQRIITAMIRSSREMVLEGLASSIAWTWDRFDDFAGLPEDRRAQIKRFSIGFGGGIVAVGIMVAGLSMNPTLPMAQNANLALFTPSPLPNNTPHEAPAPAVIAPASLTTQPEVIQAVAEPKIETVEKTVKIRSGDTLAMLLSRAKIDRQEAHRAVLALRDVFNPRKLRAGQSITLVSAKSEGAPLLQSLSFKPEPGRTVSILRDGDTSFTSSDDKIHLQRRLVHRSGTIDTSLYEAAMDAGIPPAVLADMIMTYSFDVDFQRDIRRKDTFEAMFEQYETPDGKILKTGRILFASMTVAGKPLTLYRYKDAKGDTDYYDQKGKSVRKALLRTPINGARLSSRYGNRRHPVLGYNRMHKGVDFAAPRGTPIYAAGNGTVEMARVNGGFGKYVRIRHNGTYSTAYAHLKGWGRGIKEGRRVKQGQIIGYVGTTGRSTGPHLHYEVLFNKKQMNPLKVKLPSGKTLKGRELARFSGVRDGVDFQLASLKTHEPTQVAALP